MNSKNLTLQGLSQDETLRILRARPMNSFSVINNTNISRIQYADLNQDFVKMKKSIGLTFNTIKVVNAVFNPRCLSSDVMVVK